MMKRYYYHQLSYNIVFVYSNEFPEGVDLTDLSYLGSTDNPRPKMAVSIFLPDSQGVRIIDFSSPDLEIPSWFKKIEELSNATPQSKSPIDT